MYAVVTDKIKTVFEDWRMVEKLRLIYPYAKYRKFRTEEQAWAWLTQQHSRKITTSVWSYGDTFKQRLVVDYIIGEDSLFFNVNTKHVGYVKMQSDDRNVSIDNKVDSIAVKITGLQLNNNLITAHLTAILAILNLLGPVLDVEFILPNHSLFYALTRYTGNDLKLQRLLNKINKRGGTSWTLKEW